MCLAIYKPADTAADWDAYENGHTSNNDSWGFAVVVDNTIVTRCGIGKFAEFRAAFEPYADKQAIIHFRWATHGSKTEANCHPFMVADDLAVIHNGVICIKCNLHADRSDTWHFNELVLKPMHERDPDFFLHADVIFTQELAHDTSKFCFLRADGTYQIWNAEDGTWEKDGHWYSNDSYESWYGRYTGRTSTACTSIGFSTSSTTTQVKTEREWIETEEGRWKYVEDDASGYSGSVWSEDDEDDAYTSMRESELMTYGFDRRCLSQVRDLLGNAGIEALHDMM